MKGGKGQDEGEAYVGGDVATVMCAAHTRCLAHKSQHTVTVKYKIHKQSASPPHILSNGLSPLKVCILYSFMYSKT